MLLLGYLAVAAIVFVSTYAMSSEDALSSRLHRLSLVAVALLWLPAAVVLVLLELRREKPKEGQ